MERPFPKSTLVVALCLSTSNLIAHAAGLAALLHDDHKASRIFQRHQTLYSAVAFCSIVLALVIAESPNTNASPELPLAWYFFSVALSEVRPFQNEFYDFTLTKWTGRTTPNIDFGKF
jgi:hypothetical protein